MFLCIDIGNTNISLAVFNRDKISLKFTLPTEIFKEKNKLEKALLKKLPREKIEQVVICSVVPKTTKVLKKILKEKFHPEVLEVGKDVKVPVKNRYATPSKVGQDRLVTAFAAICLYGTPTIVVDFGTCITFDCISEKEEYLGGIIFPGIGMTLNSLYNKTALLPKVEMKFPKTTIGRTTEQSITNGIYYGFLGACASIIKRLKEKMGEKTLVIATGGYAKMFKNKVTALIDVFDAEMIFFGMYLILKEKERKSKKK